MGRAKIAKSVVIERSDLNAPLQLMLVGSDGARMVADLSDRQAEEISFILTRRLRACNMERLEARAAGYSEREVRSVTLPEHASEVRL